MRNYNVIKKTCETVIITTEGLDPIRLYYENNNNYHMLTIVVFSEAWSYCWSAIGPDPFWTFFCECGNSYLLNKFLPGKTTETDWNIIGRRAGIEILDNDNYIWYIDAIEDKLGQDIWYELPRKQSNEAEYLSQILDAIKNTFKETTP